MKRGKDAVVLSVFRRTAAVPSRHHVGITQ
jgi:hypothetical protein